LRAIVLLLILLISTSAAAQEDTNHSPYQVNPEVEIPLTIGAFVVGGTPRLFVDEIVGVPCNGDCNPDTVNSFDRTAIGYHSSTASALSDVAFYSSLGLPHAIGALDVALTDPSDGWGGYSKDALVLIEVTAFTLVLNNMLDMTLQRPRPLAYDKVNFSEAERTSSNAALSFPSGHTALPFALGTAYSRLYMQRHPDSPWVVPMWVGSYTLGTAAGLGRVFAGEHFWTDVMIGAAMGTGVGLLVPWLHEEDRFGYNWKVTPTGSQDSGGLNLSTKW
jgi:hypothetical protein